MAPAVQYRETVLTIATTVRTQRQNDAAAARHTRESVSSEKEVSPTSTETNSYSGSSASNWPSAASNIEANRRFPIPQIPQIQGIIPGMRYVLHINAASPSIPHSPRSSHDVGSTIPTTLITSSPPSLRRSTYPRISPPGFLYPEAIVPYTAMSAQNSNPLQHSDPVPPTESPYHSSIMGRVDYELVYLPMGYKLLFVGTLATVVLGVAWTLIVWAVNERIGRAMKEGKGRRKNRAEKGGQEKRPIDKVSKYAHRHGSGSEIPTEAGTEVDMDSDSAVTSAAQIPFSYLGNNTGGHVGPSFEMKYRPQHKTPRPNRPRSRPLHPEARDPTCTPYRCVSSSSSSSAGPRFSHPPAPTHPVAHLPIPSTAPSPVNPFLDLPPNDLLKPGTGEPLVKRTSLEWKTGRAAFFSAKAVTSTRVSRPVSLALSHTNEHSSEAFELDVSDMEALEAGTAPLTGRKHPQSEYSSSSPGNGLVKKSKSWIDEGVGFVDGAVNAFAAKIGRWTDDDGGDDALLLPVARQGRGRGVGVGVG